LIEIETTNQGMSWNVGSYLDILNHVAVWQISADQSHGYPDGFSWRWDSNIDGCKIGSPRYHVKNHHFAPLSLVRKSWLNIFNMKICENTWNIMGNIIYLLALSIIIPSLHFKWVINHR
jgi:hypothetical protein